MERCHYCGFYHGRHHRDCPTPGTPEMDRWRAGYDDGRSDCMRMNADPAYELGYLRAEVAREEAQNNHDDRFA